MLRPASRLETALLVGQVARLAGVTVRTLHHYDEIGLLSPSGRSPAGYRLYHEGDVARLQRILGFRELGFELDEIASLLAPGTTPLDPGRADDEPDAAMRQLRLQHRLLGERLARTQAMITLLERTMDAHEQGIRLTPSEMLEVFGGDDPTLHADEAKQRWGETDAYAQSRRRTATYTAQDWLRIKAEGAAVEQAFAAALADGEPANGPRAMDVAQAHRDHLGRWFYDVGDDAHRGLADLYLADPRFTANYENVATGLAQYVHDAIHANADRSAT